MKVALLGKGKTGSKVSEIYSDQIEVFDRTNVPTCEKLRNFDVVISFLPGEAFLSVIPMLLESKKPVVTGSTGFHWPAGFNGILEDSGLTWIYASNFSLGVVVLKQLIERLGQVADLFPRKHVSIHEVHHTKKLDAPSGTALSMKEWLKENCEITSERTGDVIGLHTLTLETPSEVLRLTHEAKDRALFAEGALWAANYLLQNKLAPGLYPFQKIVEEHLSL
ncbi:MAG TPA: dihydrodipicolinate reductase C-terminal domain-containing protein [Bacteriovoracaceae bacterium]|nr:dihydrodipicolinate reductase C-terminal domain-containing protein [Bacteriovoracaceae bacterium]